MLGDPARSLASVESPSRSHPRRRSLVGSIVGMHPLRHDLPAFRAETLISCKSVSSVGALAWIDRRGTDGQDGVDRLALTSTTTMSTAETLHPIQSLPTDVLEAVFLACVTWHHAAVSPLTLAAVCHQWREIALHAGRLWTDIDLSKPERARHFAQLSQGADLDVTWCNAMWRPSPRKSRSNPSTNPDSFSWLHSETQRVRILAVHGIELPVTFLHWLLRADVELPRLSALVLNATNERGDFYRTAPMLALDVRMPCLRHLTLWNFEVRPLELIQLLTNATRLESVLLAELKFPTSKSGDREDSVSHPSTLPRIQRFHMKGLSLQAQSFLMTHLHLPPFALLLVSHSASPSALGQGDEDHAATCNIIITPLSSSIFSSGDSTCLTFCKYNGDEIVELLDDAGSYQNKRRIQLAVQVHKSPFPKDLLGIVTLVFSGVQTLELSGGYPTMWSHLVSLCPAARTLILHSLPLAVNLELLSAESLPELQEVWLIDVAFNSGGTSNTRIVMGNDVIARIQKRNAAHEAPNRSVTRLVLCDCDPVEAQLLSAWRETITVDVTSRAVLLQTGQFVHERDRSLADWDSLGRLGPSTTASRCSACNGLLETSRVPWRQEINEDRHLDDIFDYDSSFDSYAEFSRDDDEW